MQSTDLTNTKKRIEELEKELETLRAEYDEADGNPFKQNRVATKITELTNQVSQAKKLLT